MVGGSPCFCLATDIAEWQLFPAALSASEQPGHRYLPIGVVVAAGRVQMSLLRNRVAMSEVGDDSGR